MGENLGGRIYGSGVSDDYNADSGDSDREKERLRAIDRDRMRKLFWSDLNAMMEIARHTRQELED